MAPQFTGDAPGSGGFRAGMTCFDDPAGDDDIIAENGKMVEALKSSPGWPRGLGAS